MDKTAIDFEKAFDCACCVVSQRLRRRLVTMQRDKKKNIQEVRLRAGRPLMFTVNGDNCFLMENGDITNEFE